MNRRKKTCFIIAASLIVLGLILFVGVMTVYAWDFRKLSTMKYETNTYEVSSDFDKISINVNITEIEFVLSDDDSCSIVCFELEKMKHSASVQNETLVINVDDNRKWYDCIGIFFESPKMTVYLPQDQYVSLTIDTNTGDIAIPDDFTFEDIKIKGDTSDVECFASVVNTIEIQLSTGDIKLGEISAGKIDLTTSTGEIDLNSVASEGNIDIESDTGEISLNHVVASDRLSIKSDTGDVKLENSDAGEVFVKTSTGDVKFKNSDAKEISVKTSTGDVTGTLLSEKVFITNTSTGDVDVPKTITGGKCEITTSTGDIKISITP